MKSFKDTTYGDMTGLDYKGTIDIRGLGLDSWEGSPTTFWGSFYATGNNFIDFKGSPLFKNGSYLGMSGNPLETLDGLNCEGSISDFNISVSKLKNFIGSPSKVLGMFGGHDIPTLESVEGLSPYIGGRVLLSNSNVMNLNGVQPLNKPTLVTGYGNPYNYVETEYLLRYEKPGLTDSEYRLLMYDLTKDTDLLSIDVKDIFLF